MMEAWCLPTTRMEPPTPPYSTLPMGGEGAKRALPPVLGATYVVPIFVLVNVGVLAMSISYYPFCLFRMLGCVDT
jgi:hypothetical protein